MLFEGGRNRGERLFANKKPVSDDQGIRLVVYSYMFGPGKREAGVPPLCAVVVVIGGAWDGEAPGTFCRAASALAGWAADRRSEAW